MVYLCCCPRPCPESLLTPWHPVLALQENDGVPASQRHLPWTSCWPCAGSAAQLGRGHLLLGPWCHRHHWAEPGICSASLGSTHRLHFPSSPEPVLLRPPPFYPHAQPPAPEPAHRNAVQASGKNGRAACGFWGLVGLGSNMYDLTN